MPWGFAAAAVGTIAAGAISADASKDAARTQGQAADRASEVQREMFDISNAQQQPFMQSGYGANAELSRLLGIAPQTASGAAPGQQGFGIGDLIHDQGGIPIPNAQLYANNPGYKAAWDAALADEKKNPRWKAPNASTYYTAGNDGDFARINDLITRHLGEYDAAHGTKNGMTAPAAEAEGGASAGLTGGTGLPTGYLTQTFGPEQFKAGMDPGYQWRLQQGAQGVQNTAAAGSGSLSGPALKALMEYGQGAASQEFGAAFDRFNTQQGNIFQRLSSVASLGQNAAAGVGNQGVATGASIGANIVGAGNAAAAGQVGAANAIGGAASDLGSLAYLYANRPVKGG